MDELLARLKNLDCLARSTKDRIVEVARDAGELRHPALESQPGHHVEGDPGGQCFPGPPFFPLQEGLSGSFRAEAFHVARRTCSQALMGLSGSRSAPSPR